MSGNQAFELNEVLRDYLSAGCENVKDRVVALLALVRAGSTFDGGYNL